MFPGSTSTETTGSQALTGQPLLLPTNSAYLQAAATNLTLRQQEVRSNEILLSDYAQRLSNLQAEQTQGAGDGLDSVVSEPGRPSMQSVFGSPVSQNVMLNPLSDPVLASTSESVGIRDLNSISDASEAIGQYGQQDLSAFAPRFLAPPLRGVTSPPPARQMPDILPVTTDIEVNLDTLLEQPPRLEYRAPERFLLPTSRVPGYLGSGLSGMGGTFPSTDTHRPGFYRDTQIASGSHLSTTSRDSLSVTASLSQLGVFSGRNSGDAGSNPPAVPASRPTNFLSLQLQGLMPTTTSSSETKPSSSSSKSYRPFQSIRERLKSQTLLNPVQSGSTKKHSQPSGIPKVTVIMTTSTQSVCSVVQSGATSSVSHNPGQVGVIPAVTILPATTTSTLCTSARSIQPAAESATLPSNIMLPELSNVNYQSADRVTFGATDSVLDNSSVPMLETFASIGEVSERPVVDAPRRVLLDSNAPWSQSHGSTHDTFQPSVPQIPVAVTTTSNLTLESRFLQSNILGELFPNSTSIVASTSSHTTLFENIFHRSETIADCTTSSSSGGARLPQTHAAGRAHPYRLPQHYQHRTRYMGIMGPYLESRGLNPTVTLPSSTVLDETAHLIPAAGLGTNLPDLHAMPAAPLQPVHPNTTTNPHSRDQASSVSDTETEISAHLSSSGAYFLPITEDQRLSQSSASLYRGTDSTDSGHGHSSSASSQGQEIELVVDQNENYTSQPVAPRSTAANQHTPNISVRNHDSNNNSIHIMASNTTTTAAVPSTTSSSNAVATVQAQVTSLDHAPSMQDQHQEYVRLRDSFVTMTDQIEREMNELNRRINALRETFNQSIQSLRRDRRRYESLDPLLAEDTATNLDPAQDGPASLGPPTTSLQSFNLLQAITSGRFTV